MVGWVFGDLRERVSG